MSNPLSQARCMVLVLSQAKCLVPNKDFLAFWALIGSLLVLGAVHVVYLKPDISTAAARVNGTKSQ